MSRDDPPPAVPTPNPHDVAETVEIDDLKGRVFRGLGWKILSLAVRQGARAVVAVILARLLSPDDYGVAAMVLVFSSLVFIFADLSLGAAIVQRKTLTEKDRSTVFWTSLAAGALFTLGGLAVSGPIADFYGQPEVEGLFQLLSLSFIVASAATTQEALMIREMRFRGLEIRLMAGTIAGGAAGIAVAVAGGGAWAIIAQQLGTFAISTALLWGLTPWRPKFVYSLASLKDMGRFSGNIFGTRLIFYLNRNSDNLLIGRFLGPAALGAYSLAYNVMLVPFNQISQPIDELLFPAFARMQEQRRRMAAAWFRATRLVAAIAVPLLFGLLAVAPDFIPLLLGDQWRDAIPVVQVLSLVGLMQSLQRSNGSVLQACDKTGTLLIYSCIFTGVGVVGFVCGLPWGIVGVAVGYLVASLIVEPIYAWITSRVVEASLWDFMKNLFGVGQAGLLMLGAVLATRWGLVEAGVPAALRLLVCIAVGALVYLPALLWRAPEIRGEIDAVKRRIRSRRAAGAAEAAEPEPTATTPS